MRFEEFIPLLGGGFLGGLLVHALMREDSAEATLVISVFIIYLLLST